MKDNKNERIVQISEVDYTIANEVTGGMESLGIELVIASPKHIASSQSMKSGFSNNCDPDDGGCDPDIACRPSDPDECDPAYVFCQPYGY